MGFMKTVRPMLERKLKDASLVLLNLDLVASGCDVYLPDVEKWYALKGVAIHPLTHEAKVFQVRIGGRFGKTDPAEVGDLVNDAYTAIVNAFYPEKEK
jgi:hypothetical protein